MRQLESHCNHESGNLEQPIYFIQPAQKYKIYLGMKTQESELRGQEAGHTWVIYT